MSATPSTRPSASPWADLRYGLMGLPLAFVALPLYVHLPPHLAVTLGWSLTFTGGLLLAVRVFDALIDPALGRWTDRLLLTAPHRLLVVAGLAGLLVVAGVGALFAPLDATWQTHVAAVAVVLLTVGCANSLLGVAHQAWGAALPRSDADRSRLFAWREGAGLVGVLVASALPALAGWTVTWTVLALAMALGWWAWWQAPRPTALGSSRAPAVAPGTAAAPSHAHHAPWANRPFRRLMGVFVLNGIAGAIPATLVVLFMTDRLAAPGPAQAALLSLYFACAALGLPLWLRGVRRWGVATTWAVGMVLAVAAFSAAVLLQTGDLWAFGVVCALSGLTLGADLALPSALLARVLDEHPSAQAHRGQYFGWWALAAKLNLALAAGLALPLLGLWGYQPGTPDERGLAALSLAYGGLPGVLKLMAAALLYAFFIHPLRGLKVTPCPSTCTAPPPPAA